jgi:hypothetical protein
VSEEKVDFFWAFQINGIGFGSRALASFTVEGESYASQGMMIIQIHITGMPLVPGMIATWC